MTDMTAIFAALAVLAQQYQDLLARADETEARLNEAMERLNAHGLLLAPPNRRVIRQHYEAQLAQIQEAA